MPRAARPVDLHRNTSHTLGLSYRNDGAFALIGTQQEIAVWFVAGEKWVVVPPSDDDWAVKVLVSACLYPPGKNPGKRRTGGSDPLPPVVLHRGGRE